MPNKLKKSLRKTLLTFINLLPIIIGMLLLTGLIIKAFPDKLSTELFGHNNFLDAFIGASLGGVAAGHPQVNGLQLSET